MNTKILTNPNTGITKVPKKPTTKPEEFHLSSNQRTHNREREQEEKHEFHAQPLNKKILEGIVVSILLIKLLAWICLENENFSGFHEVSKNI